jgi:tRNA threonylcarbamoyladenosine biosynthesis protein TsaE
MSLVCFLPEEEATAELGAVLAEHFSLCPVLYLKGELGAGKSALVRAALRSLGYKGAVKSPTYTLLEWHEHNGLSVLHWDLYRVSDSEELTYLGVRELTESPAVWLIEWPEQGEGELPCADLVIELKVHGEGRLARLEPLNETGKKMVRSVELRLGEGLLSAG